jgi:glycosyltransferase involved in cell wall biosynthesis
MNTTFKDLSKTITKAGAEQVPLSIVIPCKNEALYIGKLLDSLLRQTYDLSCTPIYVADAGSTDGTLEILQDYRDHTPLKIEILPGGYPARARNIGASTSNSTYLLFLDADVHLAEDDFIQEVVALADVCGLDCVGTLVKSAQPGWRDKVIWNALTLFMHAYPILKPFSSGMCIFMRRSEFEKLGGFDESVILGEDVELTSQVNRGKFGIVHRHVVTSNRRFEKMGYARTLGLYTGVRFSKKYRHRDHRAYFQ